MHELATVLAGNSDISPETWVTILEQLSALLPTKRFGTVDEWCNATGMHRTKLYELLAEQKILARKNDKQTLIDFASGYRYLNSLPLVTVRRSRRRAKRSTQEVIAQTVTTARRASAARGARRANHPSAQNREGVVSEIRAASALDEKGGS